MEKELEKIFSGSRYIPGEKEKGNYVPNTFTEINSNKKTDEQEETELVEIKVTSAQNTNWKFANFFIQRKNQVITNYEINKGQYVVLFHNSNWTIFDYKKSIVAQGLSEIENFVKTVASAEALRIAYLDNKNNFYLTTDPLQKIVYGAPGTGKSFGTDGKIHDTYKKGSKDEKEHVFRTTFHPDSDYSTFVGCYKPTRIYTNILNEQQLIIELQRLIANEGDYAVDQLGYNYWESFEYDINKEAILKACGKGSQVSHLNSGIALGKRYQKRNGDITYDFVPQSFTKAYIKAWEEKLLAKKKDEEQQARLTLTEGSETKKLEIKPVYLVIEEINRGNCAQIFGDLFQLLDRNDSGMSCYPIKPDTDLGNYIAGELRKFAQEHNIDIDATGYKEIINGEEMLLPNNLYIWATMNTSDQSLFPIDSAFKRRWDWEYVPISEGFNRKTGDPIKNTIKIGDYDCDWWEFVKAINKKIGDTTKSEDKKLGFYFCKADSDGIIDAKKFVGKVIFYLWNDVFKDYETDIFDCLADEGGEPSFEKLYKFENGEIEIDEIKVKAFIEKVCPGIFSKVNSEEKQKEEE